MKILPHDTRLVCTNCKKQLAILHRKHVFSDKELELLEHARRALVVNFPAVMDDGSVRVVEGYRVQYNDALGPTKGGIRIHENTNFDEVSELAFLMSLKTSLAGLPYGGAKGAIRINPNELSPFEHERVVRGFIREIARFIGPDHDIPAPDINTNPETMALMLDEYEHVVGHKAPAAFTGKPFARGGSLGRDTATSKGGFYIITEYFSAKGAYPPDGQESASGGKNKNPHSISVAIQGFGNVGSHLGELLAKAGFRVIAVSDSSGGVYQKDGLPMDDIIRWKRDKKNLVDFTNSLGNTSAESITNEKLLELPVDVLIPSALGGVITETNAPRIHARLIIEMANAPVTPDADPVLKEKGVAIIPDILANSGGVIVSYFEWLQNRAGEQWTADKVDDKLKKTILLAYRRVMDECARRPKFDMRTVSYLLAVQRIVEVEKERK
ncbi:Glu/Leu/Phe/Val dehydrogenase [Candidatus Wolfebacteria bacterium]|nr:Glu/Leu/Phe/Val dehydrogenase [Candidatus Wolfebacteria bacterium]